MVEVYNKKFSDWREFLSWIFSNDRNIKKISEEKVADTFIEKYSYEKNRDTIIKVGYIDNFQKLIYLQILNSNTPGFTRYQNNDLQYFEQGQYNRSPYYGGPGLDFDFINIKGVINDYLLGIEGKEVQYIKNDQVLRSQVIFAHSKSLLYNFENISLAKRILKRVKGTDKLTDLEKKEIKLNTIFDGLEFLKSNEQSV